jgi:hypothetical protein
MASKKLSSDTSLANSYKLSRGVASVARPSAPTIGTATDGGTGNMSVTFTASTLGPTASSYTLLSSSGVTGSGASSPLTLQEAAVGTYTYTVSGVNANGTGPSSAASNSVVVASVYSSSYESISTVTVGGGGASTITFSSIPATYKHLQIRGIGRGTVGANVTMYFNGDTNASNYTSHYLESNMTTVYGGRINFGSYNGIFALSIQTTASRFGCGIIDIFNYTSTDRYKVAKTQNINDIGTASSLMNYNGGYWTSLNAITSITLDPTAGSFEQYSSYALYGIKGA